VLEAIRDRFKQCGLELHPTKTRIVYCKDDDRRGDSEHISFDFLGYTFQPRRRRIVGEVFVLDPAIAREEYVPRTQAPKAVRPNGPRRVGISRRAAAWEANRDWWPPAARDHGDSPAITSVTVQALDSSGCYRSRLAHRSCRGSSVR
jgi:hypothetical protein